MNWNMDQIPFFPKLVIYGPIILGIFFFILSFSKKQYSAIAEGLGEGAAKKAYFLFRYGGPFLVLIGIISYLIKDF